MVTSSQTLPWTWEGKNGRMQVTRLTSKVLTVKLSGKLPAAAGPALGAELGARLSGTAGQHMFWDLSGLEVYDSAVRTESTRVILQHRPNGVATLHTFTRSATVAMGVRIANVALGGFLQSHSDLADFEAALRKVVHSEN